MKSLILAASLSLAAIGLLAAAPPISPVVAAAMADKGRDADRPADARRHPGEVISFAGVRAGDKVVDLIPGSGYFTRIF